MNTSKTALSTLALTSAILAMGDNAYDYFPSTPTVKGYINTKEYERSPKKEGQKGWQPSPLVRKHPKIRRNDPCICGCGKKYKNCQSIK